MADPRVSRALEVHVGGPSDADDPAFYFYFTSPDAYMAAERVLALMPVPAAWVPVRASGLGCGTQLALSDQARERIGAIGEQRAMQRFVWPDPFPVDGDLALRAATYAKGIGRVVAFSLAAFRQCYAAGRALDKIDNVVIAASGCEMHPAAVIKGCELKSTRAALDRATQLAAARGVHSVPAVYVPARGGAIAQVFHGDDELDAATAVLAQAAA